MNPPLRLHLKTISAQGSLIILVARDERGKRYTIQIPDFQPYFYVARSVENAQTLRKRGLEFTNGRPAIDGTPTYRVVVDTPGSVPKRRKGFHHPNCSREGCQGCGTYEADVPYTRRFLVDTGIHDGFEIAPSDVSFLGDPGGKDMFCVAPHRCLFPISYRNPDRQMQYDIETNKPEGSKHYSPPSEAKGAVTALSYHDSFHEAHFETIWWHPERGTPGRPKLEVRSQWSDAYEREVPWNIHTYGSEEEMLIALLQYLKKDRPDAMQAWNGHHGHHRKNQGGFDAPYLINRLRRIGISPGQLSPLGSAFAGYKVFGKESMNVTAASAAGGGKFECHLDGVQLIDSMTTYQVKEGGFTAQVPFSDLKRVAKKFTNKNLKKDPSAIEDWWLNNSEQFLTYSFNDVDALVGLERHQWNEKEKQFESTVGYLEWAREIQQFVGIEDTNKVFAPMALITTMVLRIAKEEGICIPTADAEQEDYTAEGGHVIEPRVKGVQRRIGVLDLTMMYVHVILSGNLSPETHVPNPTDEQMKDLICVPSDLGPQFFLKPSVKEGILPKTVKRFKTVREKYDVQIKASSDAAEIKELKHRRQPAKQLLLGVWGTSLSPFFALYKKEVGSSITGTGRYIINNLDSEAERLHEKLVYGDTDSNFIPLRGDDNVPRDERTVQHGMGLAVEFNAMFDRLAASMNMEGHTFKIGLETIIDPFVQGDQKKMYAGYIVWQEGKWQDPPVFMAAGVQAIKSDAAPITKETGEAVLKAILNGASAAEIMEYVRTVHDGILTGDIPLDDVIKTVGLGSDPDSPKTKDTYIVKAARHGKSMYDFQYTVGGKVRVVRLKGGDENWVAIPEGEDLPDGISLDLAHHAELTVLKPIRNILAWIDATEIIDSIHHGTVGTTQRRL